MEAITFDPIYKTRIWGSRLLEERYGRQLPDATENYGEAWEIVDREDAQSIVSYGDFAGTSLHELWTQHREEVFGSDLPDSPRFPLLIKILDAAADLSIQVHPPADIAEKLGGEPKTEMWFIAHALPDAKLYVGLRKGTDRQSFEAAIKDGSVADQVHAIIPKTGDSIFIESGRLHAIGAGFLIHEIQQNSDTTYRVFDWNRLDDHGNPRDLHVEQSLACIDFSDFEPSMDTASGDTLAICPFFKTTRHSLAPGESIANPTSQRFSIITVVKGLLAGRFSAGQSVLLPKSASPLSASTDCEILQITIP
jgi:mannose-6-phosphate isomerase